MKKTKILKDPLHYIGWGITTGVIIAVFHLMNIHSLHTPWYNVGILYLIVMGVDVIKHLIKLQ